MYPIYVFLRSSKQLKICSTKFKFYEVTELIVPVSEIYRDPCLLWHNRCLGSPANTLNVGITLMPELKLLLAKKLHYWMPTLHDTHHRFCSATI